MVHTLMTVSGLDTKIDHWAVNGWLERRRQSKSQIMSVQEGNDWLLEALTSGRAFAAGKLGDIELMALCWHLKIKRFYKYTWQPPSFGDLQLDSNAGVFPRSEEVFHRFADRFLEAVSALDLAAVWFNPGEDKILQCQAPKALRTELKGLEPWFSMSRPWTEGLKGRRVLVIHPFEATIQRQYRKRAEIWRDCPGVLPELEMLTLKAPYGFSKTAFADWMEMLAWMEGEMERLEEEQGFDIALIGCGAASLPLAAKAKSMGKVGIHLGGPLQLLFGIRGQRWDQRAEFQPFFNDAWCRPDESEKPTEFKAVDKGGYW